MKWTQLYGSLNILWHCISLGLEWKLTFYSPGTTAKFSKFVDILSAWLSHNHLLGFEITHLDFHHLHWLCSGSRWITTPSCPANQSKTQFSPQPVPPIRKLAQASYPHASEGIQKEKEPQWHGSQYEKNHSLRKLTKMITEPYVTQWNYEPCRCRATQDRQDTVERTDKTWPTGKGNGKLLQFLA